MCSCGIGSFIKRNYVSKFFLLLLGAPCGNKEQLSDGMDGLGETSSAFAASVSGGHTASLITLQPQWTPRDSHRAMHLHLVVTTANQVRSTERRLISLGRSDLGGEVTSPIGLPPFAEHAPPYVDTSLLPPPPPPTPPSCLIEWDPTLSPCLPPTQSSPIELLSPWLITRFNNSWGSGRAPRRLTFPLAATPFCLPVLPPTEFME